MATVKLALNTVRAVRKGTAWFATNAKQDSGAISVQWNALKAVLSNFAMQLRDTALKAAGKGLRMTSVTNVGISKVHSKGR